MSKKNKAAKTATTPTTTTTTETAIRPAAAPKPEKAPKAAKAETPKAPVIPPRNPNAQHGPSAEFARLLFRVDRELWQAIRDHAAKNGEGIQPAMRKLLAKGLGL